MVCPWRVGQSPGLGCSKNNLYPYQNHRKGNLSQAITQLIGAAGTLALTVTAGIPACSMQAYI